jgi:DNA invertase Pin-like site-specific DNA recombinase
VIEFTLTFTTTGEHIMNGELVGYTRVSSIDQNTERQLEGIDVQKLFTDKASGKDVNRPQLQAAMTYLRHGDTLVVHSMDRLARNVEDMLRIVRELTSKGVVVRFVKENMIFEAKTDDPRSTLMFTMLSAFSQFERSLIKERQREGIAIAKAKGVYAGSKPKLSDEQVVELKARVAAGVPKSKVAKQFKISRETVYQYLKHA